MNLHDDSRQWDYSDPAQRILIAERALAMLDALAANTPAWDDHTQDNIRENLGLTFAYLTNARCDVDRALRFMRDPNRGSAIVALHSCSACGRHPSTHQAAPEDNCGACGLGEERG